MYSDCLRFDLPWLPPAEVRGNSRAHWAKKHRASKRLRESGYAHALESGHEPFQRACVRFEFRHWRSVDLDNLSIGMKGFLDGLVDAGLIQDDSGDLLQHEGATLERVAKGAEGVTVYLWEKRASNDQLQG